MYSRFSFCFTDGNHFISSHGINYFLLLLFGRSKILQTLAFYATCQSLFCPHPGTANYDVTADIIHNLHTQ